MERSALVPFLRHLLLRTSATTQLRMQMEGLDLFFFFISVVPSSTTRSFLANLLYAMLGEKINKRMHPHNNRPQTRISNKLCLDRVQGNIAQVLKMCSLNSK